MEGSEMGTETKNISCHIFVCLGGLKPSPK